MKRVAAVLLAGAAFGVVIRLTWHLHGHHELDWVSRVAWPWLLAAFAAGLTTTDRRRAAREGAVLLTSATVAYYAVLALVEHHYTHSPVGVWWVLVAVPAGALAAAAGAAVRSGPPERRLVAAVGFASLVALEALGTTGIVTNALHDLRDGARAFASY
jgi:hypothetical protein